MVRCSCGAENLSGTVFCERCGAQLTTFSNYVPRTNSNNKVPTIIGLKNYGKRLRQTVNLISRILRQHAGEWIKQLNSFLFSRWGKSVKEIPSPFIRNQKKYEASVPLIPTFRFIHEPVGMTASSRFIGRQADLETLAERILFSEGGSFLVTGYRGVGKTSFVNQVIRTLESALPWAERTLGRTEIIDIYLNVARPIQPSEMMHHIIRRLYDRLNEKSIFQLLDHNLQAALTLAYHRTSVNMVRKQAESSERSFGFNEASLGTDWMKAAVKMSWNSKRSSTNNYEISYLGYDDKAAEHDVIAIARALSAGYVKPRTGWDRFKSLSTGTQLPRVRLKIVFVFDELDKLEEFSAANNNEQTPIIDQILGSLKNLFTTSGVTFVFVAGKDLQERWLDNVGKGDSVYESVFSYDKYLPCLWVDADAICDQLVERIDLLSPYHHQIYEEFKKYLTYKGRGIPRRIIRTFNEYVEWNDDHPILAFSKPAVRRVRFFAGLQDVLRSNEKSLFGETHEEFVGTQSDKRRLGIYYLIDWIFRQGSSEFRLKDVLNASKRLSAKIALAEEVLPDVAGNIIKILLSADYLQEIRNSVNRVVINKANEIQNANVLDEKRYRISPRRLGEIGGLAADVNVEVGDTPTIAALIRKEQINGIAAYEFVRLIGRGGMGAVYEAIDNRNGRRAAVKVIMDSTDSEMLRRFKREALIMRELNHPNIVRLYESGEDDDQFFIAMEFLDGLTLEELINRQGILSLNIVIAIAKLVARAAHYIHEKGFVRNDIKPTNIMLTNAGRVCLLDFGITRPVTANLEIGMFQTETRVVVGTFQFMAPEQFDVSGDQPDDARSDIFSLGVVLYRMLTGVYPFDGTPRMRLAEAQTGAQITPPSHLIALPPAIDTVVLKCLQKDPADRFQTMMELETALAAVAEGLPDVDLRSIINVVRLEVEEVQAMDDLATVEPSTGLVPPARIAASNVTLQPGLSAVSKYQEPRLNSILGHEEALPALQDTFRPTRVERPHAVPCITMIAGRTEDVDFPITAVGLVLPLRECVRVGRSSDNDLVLRDEQLSRYHGQFDTENGNWFVEDFNSSGGTFVNGERILTRRFLTDGDKIQIGGFIFQFNKDSDYLK